MARYAATFQSQAAQLATPPATTTVNGYLGCWVGSATSGFRLRRLQLSAIAGASVPTSQQVDVGIYRQTVTPSGTGLTTVAGVAMETHTPQTDPTGGLIVTTATTIGTTGPTLSATPLLVVSFNTQTTLDLPFEFLEELVVGIGAANGLGFVNLSNALPAAHRIRLGAEVEV